MVFAAVVPPDLVKTADNPKGPLTAEKTREEKKACQQSAQHAALACMDTLVTADLRDDLKKVTVPTANW